MTSLPPPGNPLVEDMMTMCYGGHDLESQLSLCSVFSQQRSVASSRLCNTQYIFFGPQSLYRQVGMRYIAIYFHLADAGI